MGVIYKNGIPYGGGSSDVSSLQDIFDKDNTQDVVGDNTLSFIQNDAKIDLSDPEAVEEFENSSSYKGLEIDNDHIVLESGESNIDFSLNHEEVEMNAKLKSSFREALGIVDGGGHTIEDQTGTDLTQRSNMQFVDSHLTDDSTNDRTKVEVIKPISKEDLDGLGAGTDGFYVTPEEDDGIPASDIDYDNAASDLSATKVQDAIDELAKPAFTEASTRANIASGEKISTLFGKIKKWFTDLKAVAFSGSYNDLSDKPTIPAAQVNSDWNATSGVAKINNKPSLATVATSGSYNDLSNKPTIPTVNNGTLTIQKNGSNVTTFTANQSGNATANITVPTNGSQLNVTSSSTSTTIENALKIGVYNRGKDSTYSTLASYIGSVILPLRLGAVSFQASGFTDLPTTDWGYDITVIRGGGTWVLCCKQQSDSDVRIRVLNSSTQWVGNWRKISIT